MKHTVRLKVCGMTVPKNIVDVASLQPEYLGFIFYEKSPRNFKGPMPKIPAKIKTVGVFVNAKISFILEKIKTYNLRAIQLHGDESAAFCQRLRNEINTQQAKTDPSQSKNTIKLWKVFSVKDRFDFTQLTSYEGIIDYFLFDTKGKNKGGNGITFDWTLLSKYQSKTPFILSGGIGLDQIDSLKKFLQTPQASKLHAIDVNSKFENTPGIKNTQQLETFTTDLFTENQNFI
ncbi:phosphoribosylanthranilate isomerase [Aquimarina sp. W85]|uniref:phosphoribosylanthranilate isomerase n=1 Tax=Aquimarina rhodophyticola TaxID=3342246 RepID=UPI00366CBC6D